MKTRVSLIVCILLVSAALAVGQTSSTTNFYPGLTEVSYSFYGAGARAVAMGSAGVGLANDVNGGSWNPAGAWIMEGPIISASYNMFNPYGEFSHSINPLRTKNTVDMVSIGHFSFVAPVRIKGHPWVFNFNYIRNNEKSTRADYIAEDMTTKADDRSYLRTYNFGMSTRLYKQLSFGFLLNVYDGARIYRYDQSLSYDSLIDANNNIFLHINTDGTKLDSVVANGFNFTLGTMYKLDKVSIGAVIRTPFQAKNNIDAALYRVTTHNDLPTINSSDTILVTDSLTKQDIPISLAFGIGVQPTEKLTFVLDANYEKYGSVDWYYLESTKITAGGDREDTYEPVPIDWNNTLSFGGGAEYLLNTSFGIIPLRAGLRYNQLPQPKDYTITATYLLDESDYFTGVYSTTYLAENRQSEMQFSLGTGLHWSKLYFDFTWRMITGAELNSVRVTQVQPIIGAPEVISSVEQNLKTKVNEFNVSMIGYF